MNIFSYRLKFLATVFSFAAFLANGEDGFHFDSFPDDFRWGITTSVYKNTDNGTQRLTQDIRNLKYIGVSTFKLALDWDALTVNTPNTELDNDTVDFYTSVIDELQNNGIEPHITLFEKDIPAKISENVGGWLNVKSAEDACAMATSAFNKFGSKVKFWSTFADPINVATKAYGDMDDASVYKAVHNMLKAHACIYKEYNKTRSGGKIGMNVMGAWFEPKYPKEPNITATLAEAFEFEVGWIAEVLKTGSYPPLMKEKLGSKLPTLTEKELSDLINSTDFLGVAYYGSFLVAKDDSKNSDKGFVLSENPMWKRRDDPVTYMYAQGLRLLLKELSVKYPGVDLYVTDTGVADVTDGVRDKTRVEWIREHANEVLKALNTDKLENVKGFSVRTLVDEIQSPLEETAKEGLFKLEDDNVSRTKKSSAVFYKQVRV